MITPSSIAFEDFLGSSIAPQVMPPCHQPEPPVSQPEEQEVKFSDTDAFSKLPDSTVVDVEEDTKDTKEAKTAVSTNYRCTFCPSPGLVPLTEKISHQVSSKHFE